MIPDLRDAAQQPTGPFPVARAMGLYEHKPTPAPCALCGRSTTRRVPTAIQGTGRPKRFQVALAPECTVCQCDRALAIYDAAGGQGDPGREKWARYRRALLAREAAGR